ncbi:AAA family ATPase [Acinetobacter zhairhuonensis]|uniref:AAA family ATPase n=1 Tax=Acinetobacter sp. A7.4 TaxID=2919921 RepID=UPI001F4FE2A0|nr:AAA family ATPase [Acinetobacter sp. A7.4]MCJ8161241.1 AAA family ATPase [Acinetobacter sp. A7.4]
MKKIKVLLSKVVKQLKTYLLHILLFCLICAGLAVAYNRTVVKNEKLAEQAQYYNLKTADDLFKLNSAELANTTKFIVVSPISYSSKAIFVKQKNKKEITVYEGVSYELYSTYLKNTFEPYYSKNKNIDWQYTESMKDIHKRLGVPKDPLVVKEPAVEGSGSGALGTVINLVFIGLILWGFIYFQNRSLATSANRVEPKDIKDDLDDLVGLQDIKAELLQIEDMIRNQELYAQYNVTKKFNIMMTGPAGVGKTKIARCLAKRLDIPLIYQSAASLQSGYVGGGPKALKNLVKKASTSKRAIIFLDEAESLLMSRTHSGVKDWERDTINALLALLDGVNTTKSEIIWIVASNMDEHKIQMDDAMLRRFHLKINFRLPNFEERREILSRLISKLDSNKVSTDLDLNKIASVSSSMSPAILETLVGRASLIALQERTAVSQDILMQAFERVAVGLTDRETTANMLEKRVLIARHESGHFIMQLHEALLKSKGDLKHLHEHIDVIKISTESVSKMGALGFVLSKEKELKLESLYDYELQIMQLYGGMVNEELYYNAVGVTAGAHNDIEKVTRLLKVMIGEVGFYQDFKLNYSVLMKDKEMSPVQLDLIEQHSKRLYASTKMLLANFMELTNNLSDKLIENYVLEIDEALVIVRNYFNLHPELLESYKSHDKLKVA